MPLDPKTTRYSLDNALACAKASLLAYDPAITSAKIADAFGLNVTEFVRFKGVGTDAEGFLALMDGAVAIVFRGTDTIANWLDDGAILLLPFRDKGAVHSGFRLSLDSVWSVIAPTLERWKGGGRTLWITGHSLGGALAHLAAAYLRFPLDPTANVPKPVAGLYTFGQPRIGTQGFCTPCDADFGSLYFRFVNDEDIVTRVPPRLLGYWHAGDLEYIDAQGVIHDDIAWWHGFLDAIEVGVSGLKALRAGNPPTQAIQDHSMTLYLGHIQDAWDQAHPTPTAGAAPGV
jgi:triacylglycerol lipase